MERHEIHAGLLKKLEIIDKIRVNTETQSRFVRRREMTGLRRLLRERAVLMNELAILDIELRRNDDWKVTDDLKPVIQAIEAKQLEILNLSDQAVQDALSEQNRIMAELSNVRMLRRLKNRYDQPWAGMSRGSRLNLRG